MIRRVKEPFNKTFGKAYDMMCRRKKTTEEGRGLFNRRSTSLKKLNRNILIGRFSFLFPHFLMEEESKSLNSWF